MGDISPSKDAPFGALIATKNAQFRAPPPPSVNALNILILDYLLLWLASKRGHFWSPAGFPGFSWRSGEIPGDISPYRDDLVEALIARKNAQNWAPFPSLLHMSLIYPLFRRPSAAISSKKGPFWRPMGRA